MCIMRVTMLHMPDGRDRSRIKPATLAKYAAAQPGPGSVTVIDAPGSAAHNATHQAIQAPHNHARVPGIRARGAATSRKPQANEMSRKARARAVPGAR